MRNSVSSYTVRVWNGNGNCFGHTVNTIGQTIIYYRLWPLLPHTETFLCRRFVPVIKMELRIIRSYNLYIMIQFRLRVVHKAYYTHTTYVV